MSGTAARRPQGWWLASGSAPVVGLAIMALLGAGWLAAIALGGAGHIAPHWFYLPVMLAGLRFGLRGAALTGVAASIVAGPLLPADVATWTGQAPSDWVSRGVFFIAIGLVVARLFTLLRRSSTAELRAAELELTIRAEKHFRALVERSSDVVTVLDEHRRISFTGGAVEQVFGQSPGQLTGRRLSELVHPDDQAGIPDPTALPSGQTLVHVCRIGTEGDWRYIESTATNLLADPDVAGVVLNSRDVSDRKALEQQLTHQALHDPLTGLANRALFNDRLAHALSRHNRTGESLAVLILDLDDFKVVNDSLGHHAGDDLLVAVAERLAATVRTADTAARLGGDEFAVLLDGDADPTQAAALAQRLVECLLAPFDVAGQQLYAHASVGIALSAGTPTGDPGSAPADTTAGTAASTAADTAAAGYGAELLRAADVAMYAAKRGGKARYEVFEPGLHAAALSQLHRQQELAHALAADQLVVHYQPVVDLAHGKTIGVEALVRWAHPDRGLIPPLGFIPLAEQTGLIIPLGAWVLEQACRQTRHWQQACPGYAGLGVSVNVSPVQLRDPEFLDTVTQSLARTALPAHTLTLEITESLLLADNAATTSMLHGLRALGVKLAVDDFGTGYSSLSYLRRLPIDILKRPLVRQHPRGTQRRRPDPSRRRDQPRTGPTHHRRRRRRRRPANPTPGPWLRLRPGLLLLPARPRSPTRTTPHHHRTSTGSPGPARHPARHTPRHHRLTAGRRPRTRALRPLVVEGLAVRPDGDRLVSEHLVSSQPGRGATLGALDGDGTPDGAGGRVRSTVPTWPLGRLDCREA